LFIFDKALNDCNTNAKSIFEITKMDCPSEENLIRTKLDGMKGIREPENKNAN